MITIGVFPDSFKTSKIVPLFKKGDSPLLSNYRPIFLLPTISMILTGFYITNYNNTLIVIIY